MKNFQVSLLTSLLLACLSTLPFSCKKDKGETASAGSNSNTRTTQEELDFVKSKAISMSENPQGYWEATFENNIVMILVPASSFTMGNNDLDEDAVDGNNAFPIHQVNLSHYWLCKTPVTTGQFRAFVNETNYVTEVENSGHTGPYVYDFSEKAFTPKFGYNWDNAFKDVTARYPELTVSNEHPVSCLTWDDCIAYTNWLKGKTGLNFTLPTEAEWERAARGTDQRTYPWGNSVPDGTKANYADAIFNQYFPGTEQAVVHAGVNDGYAITSPVTAFSAGVSPIGAYDMAGNLIEWVYDSEYVYSEDDIKDPINTNGDRKLQRGGFWVGSAGRIGANPDEIKDGHNIRSDSREGDDKNSADDHLGFRIAISYTAR